MKLSIYFRCFFALCVCAALFACSEEKTSSHADLCADGPSVECLLGNWRLDAIEKKPGEIHTPDIGGTLNFSNENGVLEYEFNSLDFYHRGTWELDTDSTIFLICGDSNGGCLEDSSYKINVDIGGDILRIYDAPISYYEEIAKPIEKYQFLP